MADSIGLIERAAALLRQREAADLGASAVSPAAPTQTATRLAEPADFTGSELVIDRGQLASYGITIPSSERSRTVEEFRLVKRNLMASWTAGNGSGSRRGGLIMVTSARPGEGKTFVALNLALAFASEREAKALLVDVDSQHSSINSILGLRDANGIVEVLAGTAELSEALIHTNIPNLLVIPAGRGGPHVPELFSSSQMAALAEELTRRFPDCYIILDTPPCMASSDAAALAPLVGQIVFVVEANRTQQEEIEAALSTLSACPRISLLLNKSELASAHFGSYGYGYHYSGGESDELRSDRPARS